MYVDSNKERLRMAYVSQKMKRAKAPAIKAVLKKYNIKGTISVDNHSSLVVTLTEGKMDFIGEANRFNREYAERHGQRFFPVEGNYEVNTYHLDTQYKGKMRSFFKELLAAMRGTDWFDNSNSMIDYFHIAFYTDINVGRWNRPYVCTGRAADGTVNGVAEENYTFA